MQNMKNAVLVLTAFLFLFPYKLMAENKVNAERKSKVDDNTAKMQSIKWLGV